jgi:hypothetical protein
MKGTKGEGTIQIIVCGVSHEMFAVRTLGQTVTYAPTGKRRRIACATQTSESTGRRTASNRPR